MSGHRLAALAVVLAALLAHLPAADGAFVYDDHRFIERNAAIERIDPWAALTDPATASAGTGLDGAGEGITADIYRPLRTLLFSCERAVFGTDPTGWHVVSLLLHAFNAWLVLRLLLSLLGAGGPAALGGALLFAVHPVAVESVAWISSQGDLLALTLMLLALATLARPGLWRTLVGAALGLLACLAKESAVVLPAFLVLRDLALKGGASSGPTLPARLTWTRAALLAAVVAAYFVLRAAVVPGDLAQVPHPGGEVLASARGALAALAWYAGALLWPSGFRFETDLAVPLSWGEPAVVVGLGLLVTLLLAGAFALRRGRPGALLFGAWGFLVALGPVSQVLVPLKTLAAERFLYPALPCVAAGLAALALSRLAARRHAAAWLLVVLALPLGLVANRRARAWADEESLWEAVRADRPSNARAYEGLGFALFQKGRYQDAERAYRSYLEFNPYDGKALRRFADHLGAIARTLVSNDPEVNAGSDLAKRRAEVQALQIVMLERALAVWEEVGFAAGRGSEAWAVDTWRRLRDASIDVGDLDRAKRANDWFIARAGVDPSDPARVAAAAPLDERVCRWFLAWMAVTTPAAGLTSEPLALRRRQRQSVLRDVGLGAERSDEALVRALEPPLVALRAERERLAEAGRGTRAGAMARRGADELGLLLVELLQRTGRPEEAQRVHRELVSRALSAPGPAPR